jgi:hypothetical protein
VLRFDHVILTARDVDATAESLYAQFGLASIVGGRHQDQGTGNRIVPLGPDYLEIMGIVDPVEAERSALGVWVDRQTSDGDRLAAVCLRTQDIDTVGRRLGLEAQAMSRRRPDGTVLHWRLAGLAEALAEPPLPFFITWDVPPADHPGRSEVDHRIEPRGISWVELRGDEARLSDWLGAHDLELRVRPGRPGLEAVGIATASGEIVLRN